MAFARAFLPTAAALGYGKKIHGRILNAGHAAARYNAGIGCGTAARTATSALSANRLTSKDCQIRIDAALDMLPESG